MTGKRIIYYILAAFIAGNFLLIYIQYNSAKNINALIGGNKKLLQELKTGRDLKTLEKDLLAVESKIRGTVSADDSSHIEGLERRISGVEADIRQLQRVNSDDSSVQYIDILDNLFQQKLLFSKQVLNEYHTSGKNAAEKLIAAQREKQAADSILIVAGRIDDIRRKLLDDFTLSTDENGAKALRFGTILIILVLVSGAALFWFIINTIRNQNQLIRQLNISEKNVKEAAAVKEKFLANMSHEIRTPLNAILGFTRLLKKKKLDDDAAGYVQTIEKSGQNLLSIVNDILDLSKIEAGMMRIESVPFNIRHLVQTVESMFSSAAAEKHLQLSFDTDSSMPEMVEGDPFRLTQILVNLVSNALKFTQQGSISLYAACIEKRGNRVFTGITVRDTGMGISSKKLDVIFERFQQAEDAVTRSFGGTGLGLSIVKELVEMQQGTIEAESGEGSGTVFRIVIPYKVSTTGTGALLPENNRQTGMGQLHNAGILVVEDNQINQTLMGHLLNARQIPFDIAGNGQEAINKLRVNRYDLILMDIQMPEMDGYTATELIRNQLKLDTPIIAITAHALTGEKEKCIRYGMNEYLSKPIDETLLYQFINRFAQTIEPGNVQNINCTETTEHSWQYINLRYLKEVSRGNKLYEQQVTGQFIDILPGELEAMEVAWREADIPRLRKLAHDMKTTVSVMGLDTVLQSCLDALEYNTLDEPGFVQEYGCLKKVCTASLEEAKIFLASL